MERGFPSAGWALLAMHILVGGRQLPEVPAVRSLRLIHVGLRRHGVIYARRVLHFEFRGAAAGC